MKYNVETHLADLAISATKLSVPTLQEFRDRMELLRPQMEAVLEANRNQLRFNWNNPLHYQPLCPHGGSHGAPKLAYAGE